MRRIPVIRSSKDKKIVGYLMLLDEMITDVEVSKAYVSWGFNADTKQLVEVVLLSKPKITFKNDPQGVFSSKVEQSMPPDERDRRVD